jgi:aminomethyltransferase
LKKTPFHALHLEHEAMMVDFGGWHMPVRYSGDKKEHHAVRGRVGLFDVSHMGEISIKGKQALALLQYLTCNDVARLDPGKIHYNVLMSPQGGFMDDVLVYHRDEREYLVVVNAANREKDFAWIREQNERFGAEIEDESDLWVQLAIQGPQAVDLLEQLTALPVRDMRYYRFAEGEVCGAPMIVSRTGYTASDGFELYFAPEHAEPVWRRLFEVGSAYDLIPCGLGSRDSLRIEGAMHLYGNEMNEETTVLEASLDWVVKLDKGKFIGQEVLQQQAQDGVPKRLVGFEMTEFGIPRHGYPVWSGEERIGTVTSGLLSPTLEKPIGLTYVPSLLKAPGTVLEVEIRQKRIPAKVVSTPFYRVKR